ncbi:MAG: M28 family peptidase [Calditrichae bacterium]|nr:M28 family peptidase [Calditrichia bacterium]
MRKKTRHLFAIAGLLGAMQCFAQTKFEPVLGEISRDSLRQHMAFLGSDALAGRGTGTPGELAAADYIRGVFRRYNLQSPRQTEDYFQMIPMHGSLPLAESVLRIHYNEKIIDLNLGSDYLLMKTGPQTFVSQPVEMVFAGYGIVAPEFDYNDYQNTDVRGKIVVAFSGEPPSENLAYFDGKAESIYALPEAKLRQAISRGALGILLIADQFYTNSQHWERLQREFTFEDVTLAYRSVSQFSAVLNPVTAYELLQKSGIPLDRLRQNTEQGQQENFTLNSRLSFKGEFIERNFRSPNVIGFLPGNDPVLAERTVIVSAHYDHLGIGPAVAGDSIYNGVFDNAAGVAATLEIARVLSESRENLRRSVLFVLLTGEEKGLLGSQFYVDHPVVPLFQTVANVNIDGLAMFDLFDDIVGIGAELSSLDAFLANAAGATGLQVANLPEMIVMMQAFDRSDQIAFAQAGIPSVLTMEGLNYRNLTPAEGLRLIREWGETRYHTPFDDMYQPMNLEAARLHTRFLAQLCAILASSDDEPQWHSNSRFRTVRLQTIAEKR